MKLTAGRLRFAVLGCKKYESSIDSVVIDIFLDRTEVYFGSACQSVYISSVQHFHRMRFSNHRGAPLGLGWLERNNLDLPTASGLCAPTLVANHPSGFLMVEFSNRSRGHLWPCRRVNLKTSPSGIHANLLEQRIDLE